MHDNMQISFDYTLRIDKSEIYIGTHLGARIGENQKKKSGEEKQ